MVCMSNLQSALTVTKDFLRYITKPTSCVAANIKISVLNCVNAFFCTCPNGIFPSLSLVTFVIPIRQSYLVEYKYIQ